MNIALSKIALLEKSINQEISTNSSFVNCPVNEELKNRIKYIMDMVRGAY